MEEIIEVLDKPQNIYDFLSRTDLDSFIDPREVDLYLFCVLAYAKFEALEGKSLRKTSLAKFAKAYEELPVAKKKTEALSTHFVRAFGNNSRYKDLQVGLFRHVIDAEKQIQFAALTVFLPNDAVAVAFRGTDESVLGWKEDANLAYMERIPSQPMASEYLKMVAKKYPDKEIYVCGHSKGGLLAITAALEAEEKIQDRIPYIFDGDCPGLRDSTLDSPKYLRIMNKIHTFIPENDIVGLVFRKRQKITVVSSIVIGPMQHYQYSWLVRGYELHHVREIASGEELDEGALNVAMSKLSEEELQRYIDTIYSLVDSNDASLSLYDLLKFKTILKAVIRYATLSPEARKHVNNVTKLLAKSIIRQETSKFKKLT